MALERLQKILSEAGLASRREAEEWIREGRVLVNGKVATLGEVLAFSMRLSVFTARPLFSAKARMDKSRFVRKAFSAAPTFTS